MQSKYISKDADENGIIHWTEEENDTWKTLITRQLKTIENRACKEFFDGLKKIEFTIDTVPQHQELNTRLKSLTGWQVEPVPAIIPAQEFFTLLKNKTFPAASFIRSKKDLDYIQEPDIFHEFFGHVPLLTNQKYADFLEEFGKLALDMEPQWRSRLFRLFWFTIEFGLVKENDKILNYGAGMLSSVNETVSAVEDKKVIRSSFDILDTLRTPYRIDIIQPKYFVLDSFDALFDIFNHDIEELVYKSKTMGDYEPLFPELGEEL